MRFFDNGAPGVSIANLSLRIVTYCVIRFALPGELLWKGPPRKIGKG